LIAVQKKLKAKESENKLLRTSNDDLLQKLQDADERIRNLERELDGERADLKNSRFDHRTLYANYLDLSKDHFGKKQLSGKFLHNFFFQRPT
jgi:regulator of replication initiation timing